MSTDGGGAAATGTRGRTETSLSQIPSFLLYHHPHHHLIICGCTHPSSVHPYTGPAPPLHDETEAAAAAFSLSQTLPQLLPAALLSTALGSALELSGNGLASLMDAGEVGWRGEGVLPPWARVVEGPPGTEAVRVEVVQVVES